jgi:phosphoenolpyruvate synthase/pyruvate phosphate dikinase
MSAATDADASRRVEFVRQFARLGREDTAYAGGKGANLGELTSAGLPVSVGFVIGALGVTGISIGSNDLTQLLLGADRDNEALSETFDERAPAVTAYLREPIPRAREFGLRTPICGQAPSVHPEYADLLVRAGTDAISVSTDVIDRTRALVAAGRARPAREQE